MGAGASLSLKVIERMLRPIAGFGLMMLLCACASEPGGPGGPHDPGGPQGGPPGGPERGPPSGQASIFISPFGEPFVSQPGDPYPVAAWFAGADADHDGRLTSAEFAADGRRWFAVLDTDHDGQLTPGEVTAYERMIDTAFLRAGGGMGGPGGGRGRGGPGGGGRGAPPAGGGRMGLGEGSGSGQEDDVSQIQPRAPRVTADAESSERMARAGLLGVPQPVRSADRNMDQRITADEWAAISDRWFSLLDTDHDGVLTLETLPRTAMQGRPPRR